MVVVGLALPPTIKSLVTGQASVTLSLWSGEILEEKHEHYKQVIPGT